MSKGTRSWHHRAAVAAWFVLVLSGMVTLSLYKSSPGRAAIAPERWPSSSSIKPDPRGTLLMFAHPRCTCTRASLTELSQVVARYGDRVSTYVIFPAPEGVGEKGWLDSDVVRRAQGMPGVTVVIDRQGLETTRFGSATSGQVLYYDQDGQLSFSGGITASRGHEGENLGLTRLFTLLRGASPDRRLSPVFGCELQDSEQR